MKTYGKYKKCFHCFELFNAEYLLDVGDGHGFCENCVGSRIILEEHPRLYGAWLEHLKKMKNKDLLYEPNKNDVTLGKLLNILEREAGKTKRNKNPKGRFCGICAEVMPPGQTVCDYSLDNSDRGDN